MNFTMSNELEISLYVLVLAVPLGLELVRRVSPLLHTPLMSLTNAISAISVVGAILVSGAHGSPHAQPGAGMRGRGCLHHQYRRRIPHHRPHAEDVPEKRGRK